MAWLQTDPSGNYESIPLSPELWQHDLVARCEPPTCRRLQSVNAEH